MNLTLQEQHGEQSTSQEAQVIKLLLDEVGSGLRAQ